MSMEQADALVNTASMLLEGMRVQALATLLLVGVVAAGIIALILHRGLEPK